MQSHAYWCSLMHVDQLRATYAAPLENYVRCTTLVLCAPVYVFVTWSYGCGPSYTSLHEWMLHNPIQVWKVHCFWPKYHLLYTLACLVGVWYMDFWTWRRRRSWLHKSSSKRDKWGTTLLMICMTRFAFHARTTVRFCSLLFLHATNMN